MTATVREPRRSSRLSRRYLWLVPGLALAIYANAVATPEGWEWG
jgi:hypothetical protein